ncbi:MAG: glycosyltransferase family 2 protein [Armatimonadetes bacterium]|nr:glycosyltransferase family 2 protein [Armatimonadota bacterium]
MARVAVLIPAFNESDLIGDTVRAAMEMQGVEEVVVIDDGSEDETAFVAYDAGARVIQTGMNIGKGTAMNRGIAETDADVYLIIDADLGACAAETHKLLEPILADQADMSIAVMKAPPGHKAGFGCVMKLARWGIKKYGGMVVTAPISGQRAIKRELIEAVGGFERGFGVETALTIDALRKGFRIVEVPLPLTHRLSGRTLKCFLHRGVQFCDILRAIWRRRK